MRAVAILLGLVFWVVLIGGMIKPRWVLPGFKSPSRGKVLGVAVLILVTIAALGAASVDTNAPTQAPASAPAAGSPTAVQPQAAAVDPDQAARALAERTIDNVPMRPDWKGIRIDKATAHHFAFVLVYNREPAGYAQVELDTKTIARAMLRALVDSGRHPSDEGITVFVWAQQEGLRGETGKPLVRVFGDTSYDYNTDQLKFEKP